MTGLQVAYLIVDEVHAQHPELMQDIYWDVANFSLPYTKDTLRESVIPSTFHGSAGGVVYVYLSILKGHLRTSWFL